MLFRSCSVHSGMGVQLISETAFRLTGICKNSQNAGKKGRKPSFISLTFFDLLDIIQSPSREGDRERARTRWKECDPASVAVNQAYKANELEVCIMSTYLPTVFGENLLDVFDDFDRDFFRGFGRPEHVLYGKNASRLMKTDEIGRAPV